VLRPRKLQPKATVGETVRKVMSNRTLIYRVLLQVVPYWKRMTAAVICMVILAFSTGAMAGIMQPMIDEVFAAKNEAMLVPIGVAVIVIFLVKGLSSYGQMVLMNSVGKRVVADLQQAMFARKVYDDLQSFHNTPSSVLVSRFVQQVNALYGAISGGIVGVAKDLMSLVSLIVVMFVLDLDLALATFFVFPLTILPVLWLGRRMRDMSRTGNRQYGQLAEHLTQVFQSIRHVKAYNAEEREIVRTNRHIRETSRLQQRSSRLRAASQPITEVLSGLAIAVAVLYGGHEVITGGRTPGSFFAFITALLLAYEPVKRLAMFQQVLMTGLVAAELVFETVDEKHEIVDKKGAPDLPPLQRGIRLEDVSFTYPGRIPALRGVTIDIPAGKTVALVGPSGAGKSTALNLIPRFYDVSKGSVTVDGVDIRDVTQKSLRGQIALVSQEVTLFNDTIKANILYGRPNATEEEVIEAAKGAAAHDFIEALPEGYETFIGEHGIKLSGGQRQRVSIARAMLKNAPVLLLDEATSALDTKSERVVQEALEALMKGRTTVLIAHRLSTVVEADIIYVMDQGRVVEQGSHRALIAEGGLYATLWAMQTAASAEEDEDALDPDLIETETADDRRRRLAGMMNDPMQESAA
jgi:subfamily B ATP-binding cassette protein MsbA